ncbi:BRISC and BRCA1-A complex member 1 isoform X6 [Amazona aestiva]|uniref:BRISC and BRCA1-A complex member 1 isoform X6 n=1 Tax=Amazona aestiva TaxID=12930 RepID=A0A0Q3QW84_AMAAE|nr:BRISC and BRCA1-A complex member 1 isoform X6 [Amazona aestiva]
MDTSEPGSAAEEEEERAPEPRPRTRSNPEGAEDRALSAQSSVGNRSEGEGEAASADGSPQGTAPAPHGPAWPGPGPHTEVQVKTPRVNCPEKVIICLDLAEEMALPKLESFNGSKTNALNISQKMIEMFVRTKHKIDKCHEFALVVVNNDATWLSGFTSDPREVCSCLYDLETVVCKSFRLQAITNQKKGLCYGTVARWPAARRRRLGVHMLHRAMSIFLAEGERQLRPMDIQGGR